MFVEECVWPEWDLRHLLRVGRLVTLHRTRALQTVHQTLVRFSLFLGNGTQADLNEEQDRKASMAVTGFRVTLCAVKVWCRILGASYADILGCRAQEDILVIPEVRSTTGIKSGPSLVRETKSATISINCRAVHLQPQVILIILMIGLLFLCSRNAL